MLPYMMEVSKPEGKTYEKLCNISQEQYLNLPVKIPRIPWDFAVF